MPIWLSRKIQFIIYFFQLIILDNVIIQVYKSTISNYIQLLNILINDKKKNLKFRWYLTHNLNTLALLYYLMSAPLSTEPFQAQQSPLLNATCDFINGFADLHRGSFLRVFVD